LQHLSLNEELTNKKRFYMAIEKVNTKSSPDAFRLVSAPKLSADTFPKVILQSQGSSTLERNNGKPGLWQRFKLKAQQVSQSTVKFAKRHPNALKATVVAASVAVVSGVILVSQKSQSPVTVKPTQLDPIKSSGTQPNATVEPIKATPLSKRKVFSVYIEKYQDKVSQFVMNNPKYTVMVAGVAIGLGMAGRKIIKRLGKDDGEVKPLQLKYEGDKQVWVSDQAQGKGTAQVISMDQFLLNQRQDTTLKLDLALSSSTSSSTGSPPSSPISSPPSSPTARQKSASSPTSPKAALGVVTYDKLPGTTDDLPVSIHQESGGQQSMPEASKPTQQSPVAIDGITVLLPPQLVKASSQGSSAVGMLNAIGTSAINLLLGSDGEYHANPDA
jgi:hypothetical protein